MEIRAVADSGDPVLWALLVDAVAELHVRYPDYDPDPAVPNSEYWVATVDGSPMGCVALHHLPNMRGEIKRLYVSPAGRRRGVAAALLDALERRAVAHAMSEIILETGTRQPEAIALYEALGYVAAEPYGEFAASPLSRFFAVRLPRAGAPMRCGPARSDDRARVDDRNPDDRPDHGGDGRGCDAG